MCQFISFLYRPDNGDIEVFDLTSHSNTQEKLGLKEPLWCEGRYLPNGEIVCRGTDKNRVKDSDCAERLRGRFPNFIDFSNWCFEKNISGIETLDLSSLTSAQGLKLPNGIKWLDLSSLTSAQGLKLPNGIKWLYLSSLTSAQGLKLPNGIGTLYLSSLTSAQGLKLPNGIKWLGLRSDVKAEAEKNKRRKNK